MGFSDFLKAAKAQTPKATKAAKAQAPKQAPKTTKQVPKSQSVFVVPPDLLADIDHLVPRLVEVGRALRHTLSDEFHADHRREYTALLDQNRYDEAAERTKAHDAEMRRIRLEAGELTDEYYTLVRRLMEAFYGAVDRLPKTQGKQEEAAADKSKVTPFSAAYHAQMNRLDMAREELIKD